MKNLNKIFILIACIALVMIVSCVQDEITNLHQDENLQTSILNSEFQKATIDKVGETRANEIWQDLNTTNTRSPIIYDGELCSDVVYSGEAIRRGFNHSNRFEFADFWHFSGTAGDVVTIQADRVTCEMDPIIFLYDGYGDTSNLNYLIAADDNNGLQCTPLCFSYTDPIISEVVLPTTGTFTVAVWDFKSGPCTISPMYYNIIITGISCDADGDGCNDDEDPHPNSNQDATIHIDGCDSGVDNIFVTDCSTMNDLIADCAAEATNHGDFVSCVAHLANTWKAAGYISGKQKGKIQKCAARSSIP